MRFSKGSFLKMALALGVAGMLLGLGASYLRTPQYESKATLTMTPVNIDGSQLNETIQQEVLQVMSRTRLSAIIKSPRLDLYSDERRSTPLEDVIDEMRRNIRIDYVALPGRHASAFTIRFEYPDKVKAQQTVNALIDAFMYQNMEMGASTESNHPCRAKCSKCWTQLRYRSLSPARVGTNSHC